MGKIDKKKLIEKFLSEGWSGRVVKIVENFPEEPEQVIDFDALWKEFDKYCCERSSCKRCLYMQNGFEKQQCFRKFLKSKHLSAPKPKQLPVKITWKLKKEYYEFANDFNVSTSRSFELSCEPVEKLNKYYDLTKTPDYSQVKVGDVVEIVDLNDDVLYDKVTGKLNDKFLLYAYPNHSYRNIKSLTILKESE